jgi:ABC-type dipeptide/oligopeptide/nickel transport system permease subunit
MGLGFDSTVAPSQHAWFAYLLEAQRYLPDSAFHLALLAFINIPIIVIALNVLRQLVRPITPSLTPSPLTCYIGPA